MIDPNKQYRTRDGREVRIYAVDGGGNTPVHGAVRQGFGWGWSVRSWTKLGRSGLAVLDSLLDLIEVKPRIKRTVWLNVYDLTSECYVSRVSADVADAILNSERLACIPIEIDCEEGEGL